MQTKRDYYEILGLGRDATEGEIKKAYRRLAVEYHPDRNQGNTEAEDKFKEAAEAYSILSDAGKRTQYDRFGHRAQSAGGAGFSGFDPSIFGDFSDILGDFFGFGDLFGGGRSRGRRPTVGADLRYDLSMDFEEAAFGSNPSLTFKRLETCIGCHGSGSQGGAPQACTACGGRGQVQFSQGFLTVARPCPQCRGAGSVITDPCEPCQGQGRVERERKLEVSIPPGVDTGARLRLAGEGEHGRFGGPQGDLFVVIHVQEHPRLTRNGADVVEARLMTYPQAVLGRDLEVETLHGREILRIPPGTQHQTEFRLRGKGVDHLGRRGRGDHVVIAHLLIPSPGDLDQETLDLLKQLADAEGEPVAEDRTVIDRVRDLFS